jgi:putative NADPH-quinone reductase
MASPHGLIVIFMNILLVLAHPNPCSLNHAIAKAVAEALKSQGNTVVQHDLYAEKFNPILEQTEMTTLTDPQVRRYTEDLANADGIILIHPIWWGMPPAILTGWVDRVFRVGVAYRFQEVSPGVGVPVGLLKAQKAVVFNTSNTPQDAEVLRCKDAMGGLWKNCILETCGIKNYERRLFSPVISSTQQQREGWISEAAELAKKQFS